MGRIDRERGLVALFRDVDVPTRGDRHLVGPGKGIDLEALEPDRGDVAGEGGGSLIGREDAVTAGDQRGRFRGQLHEQLVGPATVQPGAGGRVEAAAH